MQILSVNDDEFKKYGRVVDNVDFTELIQELKRTPIPSGVVPVWIGPSPENLTALFFTAERFNPTLYRKSATLYSYDNGTIGALLPGRSCTGILPGGNVRHRAAVLACGRASEH